MINTLHLIEDLTCCCCSNDCRGRQWWNRDTGYGLCTDCANRIKKSEDEDYMKECYGIEGKHYNVEEVTNA